MWPFTSNSKPQITDGTYYVVGPFPHIDTDDNEFISAVDEKDSDYNDKLEDIVLQWLVRYAYLKKETIPGTQTQKLVYKFSGSDVDPIEYLVLLDFSSIIYKTEDFEQRICNVEGTSNVLTRIEDLRVELTTFIHTPYLNKLVNRFFKVMESQTPRNLIEMKAWPLLHTGYPYIWVCYLIHVYLNKYADINIPRR